jgi:transposase
MGRKQLYEVRLTEQERIELLKMVSKGKHSAREIKRAQILLKSDLNNGEGREDKEVAEALGVTHETIHNVRRRFCERGLDGIEQKKGAGRPRIVDGDLEAQIIAIACSQAPKGRVKWTLRLIADKVVAVKDLEDLSHQTVHNVLKKANLSLG